MLIQQTLFDGERNLVDLSIARLQEFEPPEGYYGAFSGGKDSVTLKEVARRAGVKVDWHYNLTTVDPPELVAFIKKYHPDVEIHRPIMSMWQLIAKKKMPPTRLVRYCCEYLKEGRGTGHKENGRVVLTGVRWAESVKRAGRKMVETCRKPSQDKRFLHPIIDWDDGDVWEFIKGEGIPYCSLYDEGFKRLGCIGCPMAGKNGMEKEFARWPKYKAAYLRAFARMIEARDAAGLTGATHFKTPESTMEWWIGNAPPGDPDQTVMFE